MHGIDAPGAHSFAAADRQRRRPPLGEIREAAACVQLSGPPLDIIKAPSPRVSRQTSAVTRRPCRRRGLGAEGPRELHLIGAVSAASGCGAWSASGRRRFGVTPGSWTSGQTPGYPLGARRGFHDTPHLFLRSSISSRSPLRRRSPAGHHRPSMTLLSNYPGVGGVNQLVTYRERWVAPCNFSVSPLS